MIYEIALLPVRKEHLDTFTDAFARVAPLLARAKGYGGHLLAQGIETPEVFNLIVRWSSLEDHRLGFEPSEDHQTFMAGLEAYLAGEPTVYHVAERGGGPSVVSDKRSAIDYALPFRQRR
ncbi:MULTISPECIES: antibiotic biosynthesis monooxygenase family protein [Cupriavidus]|jgi:heme-degrading monooxygenase HmoA|uniref:Antibiotic biosynthesis monooxygenase n=1 Tax=Cupriavidus campinensis TaxID=151783 RepID=A0AAE9I9M3_9BURK|nr:MULTISPECIES: antibiotic biosynthesis monooxygenase [Cupriavidus]TSP13737.1 antibiotic biosynthesis monooxygenase [Cupriavidus campinensis]URF06621.1 antibiotic biosynthesis monooxygenase [Cupriavidus campinensis]